MNALIIAANNNEDISWVANIDGKWIPYLNTEYQPKGREAHSYLKWICSGGGFCEDEQVFCQGDPFKHDPDFIKHLDDESVRYYGEVVECNATAAPHYEAPLHLFCTELGLPRPDTFRFVAGSQYRVTRAEIESRPKWFYEHMLNIAKQVSKAPWIFERLWPLVWGLDL